jgi:catalase
MESFWVKFHFITQQSIQNLTDAEAAEITGQDREYHQRDLVYLLATDDAEDEQTRAQYACARASAVCRRSMLAVAA